MDGISLLMAIPDAVLATGVGSVLGMLATLLGVLLVNREARKRHLEQLRHDSEERTRERQMSWRREVYLEAAASVSRGFGSLGRLVDLNVPDQEISTSYQDDLAKLARVQVVATGRTVAAFTDFSNEFASVYLQLSLDRIPLVVRKNGIESLRAYIEKADREINRYIELMKRLNLEGNVDQRLWQVINDQVGFERTQQERFSKQRQELETEQNTEHLALLKACFEGVVRLAIVIPPAVFAMRDELGLPLDVEQYMKSFNESLERTKAALNALVHRIQKLLDA